MCGIVAVLHFDNRDVDEGLLVRMRDTMYHRGPDDAGIHLDGPLALAHRRLSIIDLSETGHQPMKNEDGTVFLVFNGEIYNYIELRNNLEKNGHRFHSTSDTEVILHQYEEDGEDCVNKFNGMFAFVLWDSKEKRLFAARDRLGIKPLYYFANEKKIILASEIKAIIEDPSVERIPDYHAIADFFYAGRALGNKTMFQNIKEIEPGHMITVDAFMKQTHVTKYWDVIYNYNYSRTDKETKEELFALLDDAVKVHCRSDASLGCHLSGGLDSSTIVAFAARHRKSLKTFSIKFSDDEYIDETRYAKAVAKHVRADYHEGSPPAADMARLLPFLIWHMDIPMTTEGVFAYYTVSQLAQKYVKVSLTGHGGDELFAGYPAQFQASYKSTDMFDLWSDPDRVLKSSLRKRLTQGIIRRGPLGIYRAIKGRLFHEEKSLEDVWIQLHCGNLPNDNPIFHKDFIKGLQRYSSKDDYTKPLGEVNTDQMLDKCLYHDLRVYLPSLLHFEDRVSMAVSIESRVPFLDYRIAEFLATVPPEQKIDGMQPKYLLREVASSLLPEEVWKRKDKRPFPVPGKFWQTHEMEELTEKILLSPESLKRGIFKPGALKDACSNIDITWQLINVELWFKIFIDRDPYWVSKI
jgi:asparagine synthase (glutamine-hydrolysing)